MGRPKKPLRVIPNPYGAIDHNGQPVCAVMCHQGEHVQRGTIRYVGAKIVHAEQTRAATEIRVGDVTHQLSAAAHDITWEFETTPVDVPDIQYYHEHITRNADLIAADADTARRCGITQFIEPAKLLADSRAKALKEWDAQRGEGDFVEAEKWRKQKATERAAAQVEAAPVPSRKNSEKGAA